MSNAGKENTDLKSRVLGWLRAWRSWFSGGIVGLTAMAAGVFPGLSTGAIVFSLVFVCGLPLLFFPSKK